MKTIRSRKKPQAFTLVELVLVVVVTIIIGAFLLPMLARSRPDRSRMISCTSNLKQVGLSFRIFANDNEDKYPMRLVTNEAGIAIGVIDTTQIYRQFQVLSNEISTPRALICPADTRDRATNFTNFGNSNISYFLGIDADETRYRMILAGDRNLEIGGVPLQAGHHRLGTNLNVGFTKKMHNRAGNIAFADGSVQQATSAYLRTQLMDSGDPTNRVVIP